MSLISRLRGRIGSAMPPRAYHHLARVLGRPTLQRIDLAPLELVRTATPEQLRDARHLTDDLLPRLGLNDETPRLFPGFLAPQVGRGLRHWQYPNQFGPYLAEIAGRGIARYLEIGVQHGGTFAITVEVLRRMGPLERAIAVDIAWAPSLGRFARDTPGVRFVAVSSRSDSFRELVEAEGPFDLVLIDGDHAEEACRADFETVRPWARMIAFHDIVDSLSPGVARVWESVRREHAGDYDFFEFVEQYDEVTAREGGATFLGIGLAVRREPPAPAGS